MAKWSYSSSQSPSLPLVNLTATAINADSPSLPDLLSDLACQVQRLSPSHRDPERFHEDKSEIIAELRRLAQEIR
jgi:hypothetical protein